MEEIHILDKELVAKYHLLYGKKNFYGIKSYCSEVYIQWHTKLYTGNKKTDDASRYNYSV